MVTERAAATFAELAQSLRERGHDPQAVAHFVNRLVFCMFAEDAGLLHGNMFTRMLEHSRRTGRKTSLTLAGDLFGGDGGRRSGRVRGGSVVQRRAVRRRHGATIRAGGYRHGHAHGRWRSIGRRSTPRSSGTLFERGLDPDKRSQLGAHYTDRDKIMLIVEPVTRPSSPCRVGDW